MSTKTPAADRSHGGPGSSHENAGKPSPSDGGAPTHRRASGGHSNEAPSPDAPTNPDHSQVSGGGGERDSKHTHDPRTKR